MICDDEELKVVREQLALAKHALASLRRDLYPKNKRNFAVFSEAYVDQIAKLQAEIDAYKRAAEKSSKPNGRSSKRRPRKAS
jgi:hypothetical protein